MKVGVGASRFERDVSHRFGDAQQHTPLPALRATFPLKGGRKRNLQSALREW